MFALLHLSTYKGNFPLFKEKMDENYWHVEHVSHRVDMHVFLSRIITCTKKAYD